MKRILAIILAAVVLLPVFCINASAAGNSIRISRTYGGGYTYIRLTANAEEIHYTTDGTKPDSSDKLYNGKIKITKPCTLRAVAYENGKAVKRIKTAVQVRLRKPTIKQLEDGTDGQQRFKITAANGTIYYTADGSTPSKTNGRIVPENGIVTADNCRYIKAVAIKSGWKSSRVTKLEAEASGQGELNEYAAEVIRLVNKERASYGLPALKTNSTLAKAAQKRADEQTVKYGHTRPDGTTCFTVMAEYGLDYSMVGENVAGGQATPAEVVGGWMHSEKHRANILNPDFKYIGVGYTQAAGQKYVHYWSQLFWTP